MSGSEAERVTASATYPTENKGDKGDPTYQAHGFTQEIYHRLIGHSDRVGEEEEAQRDVKERQRGNDRFG
jgi:hypothetical protein